MLNIMRIVFWQNCLSPHQLPYIVHLLDDDRVNDVVIVAGCDVEKERRDMGWEVSDVEGLDRCELHVNPSYDTMVDIMHKDVCNSVHLFSGIRGYSFVFTAFKNSLSIKNLKRGLITERPNTYAFGHANGKPLWLHWMRYQICDKIFFKYIDWVFAIGDDAVRFFRSLTDKWGVYPFAYCTKDFSVPVNNPDLSLAKCPQIVFVGSLSWWKSVDTLLISAAMFPKQLHISLIGDGAERKKLEKIVSKNNFSSEVDFLGVCPLSQISKILVKQDVLVLPSIYDGWGAVVNEALLQGLYVICSDRCGAKTLLCDRRIGRVFKAGDAKDLAKLLMFVDDNIDSIRADKARRVEWSRNYIGGRAIARYMIDCLFNQEVEEPWKTSNF